MLILALLFAGCTWFADPVAERRPHVVLVTLDGLSPAELAPYGAPAGSTPAFERLAADGVVFEEAITTAPIPLVAYGSLLSGLLPPTHGVRDNGAAAFGESVNLLPERLQAAGFTTAAFVSSSQLDHRFNLDQGFDVYDDALPEPEPFAVRSRPDDATVAAAVAWLDAWKPTPERPNFFLWVHGFDDSARARAPRSPEERRAHADGVLRGVLEGLDRRGLTDQSLIIVTSAHGEAAGAHGEPTHGLFVYRATARVPMIWRWPGKMPAGKRVSAPVSLIDVVPTLLAAFGLPNTLTQGRDVNGALFDAEIKAAPIYTESLLAEPGLGLAPVQALRDSGYTYIRSPKRELYDLSVDPDETNDVSAREPRRADAMDKALGKLVDAAITRAQPTTPGPLADADLATLEAFGYFAPPEPRRDGGRDPKDLIEIRSTVESSVWLLQAGMSVDAATGLEVLVNLAPENITAWNALADARERIGDADGAAEARRRSLQVQPQQPALAARIPGGSPAEDPCALVRAALIQVDAPESARGALPALEALEPVMRVGDAALNASLDVYKLALAEAKPDPVRVAEARAAVDGLCPAR
jgi:choline-sulfatase